jgi:hypothetical protein
LDGLVAAGDRSDDAPRPAVHVQDTVGHGRWFDRVGHRLGCRERCLDAVVVCCNGFLDGFGEVLP